MSTTVPHPVASLGIIIRLELERLLGSRQGWLYLFAFAFFWFLALKFVIFNLSGLVVQSNNSVSSASNPVLSTYFGICLYLFPLLSTFLASNQTGSDRERGTLRFLVLRCSRASIFFGRFLSQVVIHYILILMTLISTVVMGVYYGRLSLDTMPDVLVIGTTLAVTVLPFLALMALLSVLVSSPRKATVLALLIWSMAAGAISILSHYLPFLEVLKALIPGMQLRYLTEPDAAELLSYSYIPLMQLVILLGSGYYAMKRTSL